MYQEVFPHKKTDRNCRIADDNGRLAQSTEQAIYRLLEASSYADDTGRNAWEFAVTIDELRRDGVSENELRWLVCRGYVEHATEISTTGNVRTFDRHVTLRFCEHTVFVLTSAGVSFCQDFLTNFEGREVDVKVNAVGSSFDGMNRSPGLQRPEDQAPTSNGKVVPKWDRDRRELRLGGQLVKVFKLPSPMQEAILMAFEEEGWPPKIDDPLPSHPDLLPKRRLHDTIKSLNRNQKNSLIRFMGDGTGEGIRWERNLSGGDADHSNVHLH
jgi:hypothetical protein